MEGGKLAASVIFRDFGITDSIIQMHRICQGNVVIPVNIQDAVPGKEPDSPEESGSTEEL
jgi:hypothetical protein